ncbi:MAG TPA: GTP-sensing pleiotropic transcriptional regulator CodY [Firmicutes bacterium]|nr:GTP-sensing pleiotropic transcriptional regulator CodY [Bacillota bacterium]
MVGMDEKVFRKRCARLIQLVQREGMAVDFGDVAACLVEGSDRASVYVVSQRGRIMGYASWAEGQPLPFENEWLAEQHLSDEISEALLKVGAVSSGPEAERLVGHASMIVPIIGAGQRVGSILFIYHGGRSSPEDELLGEVAAAIVGMVIANAQDLEEEDEAEERQRARAAIRSLSYSERVAMQRILDQLNGDEGMLVASRVADEARITRSVIVNALRKLSSANVIESRSLGMKGTYLRILNRRIRQELERERSPFARTAEMARRRA